jgi:hypothetical protein
LSTFIPLTILVLVLSDWLAFLPVQLEVTKQHVIIYLAVIECTSLLPSILIIPALEIRLDYLILFSLFVYFLSRIPISEMMTICSLIVMLGSILFLFHEISQISLIGKSSVFQWTTIFLSMGGAIISTKKMRGQFCLIFGGLLVMQCGIYYLYHERISPITFPGLDSLDTFWIIFVILTILKGLEGWIPAIQKNWRLAYWIKKR